MTAPTDAAAALTAARSLVVKVGSALLVDRERVLRQAWLGSLCADIARCVARGQRVTVVSSGAVALGAPAVGQPRGATPLAAKQAAAAVGQVALAQAWRSALATAGCAAAQVLLTPQDTEDRRRHLNARATLDALAAAGVVAVINENDTVATDELRYGDNDRLAGRVAQMISADLLILLSDVDGLYTGDPARDAGAEHIPFVERITASLRSIAGESSTRVGTGGMRSKLAAAEIASAAGATTVIASGRATGPLSRLADGATATVFAAARSVPDARRRWIVASLRRSATVAVDAGALGALRSGASLLPVGVAAVEHDFERGDCITIEHDGVEVGMGLASLDSRETREAMARAGGGERTAPLVHRDNLVLHGTHEDEHEHQYESEHEHD